MQKLLVFLNLEEYENCYEKINQKDKDALPIEEKIKLLEQSFNNYKNYCIEKNNSLNLIENSIEKYINEIDVVISELEKEVELNKNQNFPLNTEIPPSDDESLINKSNFQKKI